jgi:hypothetical protein
MSKKGHLQTLDGLHSSQDQTQDHTSCQRSGPTLVDHVYFDLFARKLTSTWQHDIRSSDAYIKQELCLVRAAWKTHKAEVTLARSRMYEGLMLASIMHKRVQDAISQSSKDEGKIQRLCADLRSRGIADETNARTMGVKDLRDLLADQEGKNFMGALDMTWVDEEWSDSDTDGQENQSDDASWMRRGEGSLPN